MAKILLVEDDRMLSRGIAFALSQEGHESICASTCREGLVLGRDAELALLDINLPDGNGLDLCTQLRRERSLPVIFLTANDTEREIVAGFEAGCDDYIAKPFSVPVLKQRVRAVLRRADRQETVFSSGALQVDYQRYSVHKDGKPVKLTATEYALLELLAKNKGRVLTRQTLIERLWDCNENFVDENALSVNIARLRRKIEEDPKHPRYVITVFGIGYTWGEER